MKKIFTLILCFALICSLSVSAFAAGTPEPVFSLEFDCFVSSDAPFGGSNFLWDGTVFTDGRIYYIEFDGSFYESIALYEDVGFDSFIFGSQDFSFVGDFSADCPFFIVINCTDNPDEPSFITYPYSLCSDGEHSHSFAIYEENPLGSSAPVSDTPAFITATNDGFKVMNSVITGIMSNPVLLFLLAASLIPVGIALFKSLKNAASRK